MSPGIALLERYGEVLFVLACHFPNETMRNRVCLEKFQFIYLFSRLCVGETIKPEGQQ